MYRRRSGLGRAGDPTSGAAVTLLSADPIMTPNPNIDGSNSGAGLVDTRTPQVSVSTPASATPPVVPAPVINVTPPVVVTAAPVSSGSWFTDSMFLGIPNWMLVAGGGAFLLFGTGGHH